MIPIYKPSITDLEKEYVNDALDSGWISSLGEYINRFEEEFASYVGTKYAVSVSNGTVGLHLVLVHLGIGPGDEVIVPDFTFIATANAVKYTGATPIFASMDPDTLCLDINSVREKYNEKVKGVIPVHVYGQPASMADIMDFSREKGIWVLEDCAEAHGAKFDGRVVGSIGNFGVFSFYGNKVITTGEGGMITTDSAEDYERLRFLRDHAMSKEKRYWHTELGYNYRLTNIQAALGLAQLHRIDSILKNKREIFKRYQDGLRSKYFSLFHTDTYGDPVYWLVSIRVNENCPLSRDEVMAILRDNGVDTRPFFYLLSTMPLFINHVKSDLQNFVDQQISLSGINLPSYSDLSLEEVDKICYLLNNI